VQHDRAVLSDRVQHDRLVALGHNLSHDVNAFGFKALEVGEFHACVSLGQGRGRHFLFAG
jgi:hypothetical protein